MSPQTEVGQGLSKCSWIKCLTLQNERHGAHKGEGHDGQDVYRIMEWKDDRSYLMSLRGGFLMPTTARVKPQLGVRLKAFRCRN